MFESSCGDFDIQKKHINGKGNYVVSAGLSNNGIIGKTNIKAKVFEKNTLTIDMFGNCFYRAYEYKMVTHARVFSLKYKVNKYDERKKLRNNISKDLTNNIDDLTYRQMIFISNVMNYLSKEFGYDNMCSFEKIKSKKVSLPIKKDNTIDFDFMDSFISELEAYHISELEAYHISELEAYLQVTGLKNYDLNEVEINAINNFDSNNIKWKCFNLEELFGKSSRGRRLKSEDRIIGTLPFVTAGETNEGISSYISNNVAIYSNNTITIDMFGSAKYRNYKYGCDDHIAVVHTEKINKYATIFITSAIHKSSHNGQFNYGKNFYASDADELDIMLPIDELGNIDYEYMKNLISAVEKLVIKDVVLYSKEKINETKKLII